LLAKTSKGIAVSTQGVMPEEGLKPGDPDRELFI
jgi:hypothetical protein